MKSPRINLLLIMISGMVASSVSPDLIAGGGGGGAGGAAGGAGAAGGVGAIGAGAAGGGATGIGAAGTAGIAASGGTGLTGAARPGGSPTQAIPAGAAALGTPGLVTSGMVTSGEVSGIPGVSAAAMKVPTAIGARPITSGALFSPSAAGVGRTAGGAPGVTPAAQGLPSTLGTISPTIFQPTATSVTDLGTHLDTLGRTITDLGTNVPFHPLLLQHAQQVRQGSISAFNNAVQAFQAGAATGAIDVNALDTMAGALLNVERAAQTLTPFITSQQAFATQQPTAAGQPVGAVSAGGVATAVPVP